MLLLGSRFQLCTHHLLAHFQRIHEYYSKETIVRGKAAAKT